MESTQCKNLRRIFLRHIEKAERPGEAYSYSASFWSLEEAKEEQEQEIIRQRNKTNSESELRENKIKILEESLLTIDLFMRWESKQYDNMVQKS